MSYRESKDTCWYYLTLFQAELLWPPDMVKICGLSSSEIALSGCISRKLLQLNVYQAILYREKRILVGSILESQRMRSMLVTLLSLIIMLLIVAGLIASAWLTNRRRKRTGTSFWSAAPYSMHAHPTLVPFARNALATTAERYADQPGLNLPPSWFIRRGILVSLGLLFMFMLALFVQSGLVDGTLEQLGRGLVFLSTSQTSTIDLSTATHTGLINASQQLVRISQLDPNQYSSQNEFSTWAYSACSTAAMTEVFNAYGDHLRITDVLQVEARIGEITPSEGLLRPEGIANTAAKFGFKTTWGNAWTLDQVIARANSGNPVIVSFPPDRYAGGHLLVVTGGNSEMVYLADSSLWNHRLLTRAQFLQWWEGYAAVVTPQ